jgi:hypothetical protein
MDTKQVRKYLAYAGVALLVAGPVAAYLDSGQPLTWSGFLVALGAGLALWMKKAPGTFTEEEADEMAEARALDRVRASKMPPAP